MTERGLAEAAACSAGAIDGLVDEGRSRPWRCRPTRCRRPQSRRRHGGARPRPGRGRRTLAARAAERRFHGQPARGRHGLGQDRDLLRGSGGRPAAGRRRDPAARGDLTAQRLFRLAARFDVRPTEWRSDVSLRRRARRWLCIASGDNRNLAGARSTSPCPSPSLGRIVVDEEHPFKQDDGVSYHARDMAVFRGRFEPFFFCWPRRRLRLRDARLLDATAMSGWPPATRRPSRVPALDRPCFAPGRAAPWAAGSRRSSPRPP